MQINYPNESVRRSTVGFWYPPSIPNTIQAMDVPPVYAPYGTYGYWPNAVSTQVQQTTPEMQPLAPNSGRPITVQGAAAMQGFGEVPPAASPAVAQATGQSMGPVTLVAPMPSITAPPQAAVTDTPATAPVCNSVSTWVANNPLLAALAVVGTYFALGGKK